MNGYVFDAAVSASTDRLTMSNNCPCKISCDGAVFGLLGFSLFSPLLFAMENLQCNVFGNVGFSRQM